VSGAPFTTWAEFSADAISFTQGEPATISTRPGVTRGFCGRCGTQLTYRSADTPGSIDVTACSLDDPSAVRAHDHV